MQEFLNEGIETKNESLTIDETRAAIELWAEQQHLIQKQQASPTTRDLADALQISENKARSLITLVRARRWSEFFEKPRRQEVKRLRIFAWLGWVVAGAAAASLLCPFFVKRPAQPLPSQAATISSQAPKVLWPSPYSWVDNNGNFHYYFAPYQRGPIIIPPYGSDSSRIWVYPEIETIPDSDSDFEAETSAYQGSEEAAFRAIYKVS